VWRHLRCAPLAVQVLAAVIVGVLVSGMAAAGSLSDADTSSRASATALAATTSSTTTTERPALLLAAGQADVDHPSLTLTPGAVFVDATAEQVCVVGYSASVRDVPSSLRDQVFAAYGLTNIDRSQFDVDHLIALELGGSNDVTNLWPEPTSGTNGAASKDTAENRLHDLVCNSQISLTDAQAAIVHWDTVDLSALVTTTTTAPTTTVPAPTTTAAPRVTAPPATTATVPDSGGPTALCNDGTYSYAAHHQGACSHHGGVAEFYK
jgi:hypothetical protein